jgi:lipopolysaccharide/colanic/teichoic acid biosynthesis glycosyltransferase
LPDFSDAPQSDRRGRDMLAPVLIVVDAGAIGLALALAFYLRYESGLWLRRSPFNVEGFLVFSALAVPAYLGLLALYDLYDRDYALAWRGQFGRLVSACTLGLVVVVFLTFLVEEQLSRGAVLLTWLFSIVLLGSGRWAVGRAVAFLRRRGRMVRRVLIVGADAPALALARRMAGNGSGVKVVGYLNDFRPPGTSLLDGIVVVGDPTRLEECVRRYAVDEVVVAPTAVTWESLQRILQFASQHHWPRVRLLPGLYDALTTGVKVTYECRVPMMALEPLRIRGPEAVLKNLVDCTVALCLLPLVLAVIGIAWVASLLDRAGPPLATTVVLGRGGRPFGLFSLQKSSREQVSGSWRRRIAGSRLGKLPALLNVLAGQLSLVGPRAVPMTPESRASVPLSWVRPGLTGPWRFPEAGGDGSGLPPEVEYVQGYSLWLDLRLLLGSLRRLLLRRQAVPLLKRAESGFRAVTVPSTPPDPSKSMPRAPQEWAAR